MKKLLRSLLAVMLIAMMALSFTSCAKPEKVEDKLKDMDYEVELYDDEDDIEEHMEEMFEQAEYYGLDLDVETPVAIIDAYDEDYESNVTIYWFENKKDAQDAVEAIEEYLSALEDLFDEMGMSQYVDNLPEVASKGKIVVVGYGDAFDDACDIVKAK